MELSDEAICSGIHREVDKIEVPPGIWRSIERRIGRRPAASALRRVAAVAVLSAVAIMAFPVSRASTLELIRSVVSIVEWKPPAAGAVVKWDNLPTVIQEVLDNGITSPDKRWVAAAWSWTQVPPDVMRAIGEGKASFDPTIFKTSPQLWVASADRKTAVLVKAGFTGGSEQFLWSPKSTLLFYQAEDDSWQEFAPGSRRITPYLPGILKGWLAGSLCFSPDGTQLLYNTGAINLGNKPSPAPQVTYVVNVNGTGNREIGVDVDARWEGDKVVSNLLAPEIIFATPFPSGPVWTLNRGDRIVAMVRTAASVEWRVYEEEPKLGEKPAAVISAKETSPGVWTVDWPGWASDHFYLALYLYAESRPGVPVQTGLVAEGTRVWAIRGPFEVVSGK